MCFSLTFHITVYQPFFTQSDDTVFQFQTNISRNKYFAASYAMQQPRRYKRVNVGYIIATHGANVICNFARLTEWNALYALYERRYIFTP